MSMAAIALKAEEAGLDVFATGEHHNPPFVPSSPTTMLGYIAARTTRLILDAGGRADAGLAPAAPAGTITPSGQLLADVAVDPAPEP
jgi:alkanesulfonate monooxygenase SsuD/methylene tetrahydromethanopterin reductase-like flavin-dependent oxidoreductase (luciferase family)